MKQLRTITAAFILITLLPVVYIVYELSSLNKNEKIVREIYRNQLDAILFSVNQYSDDAMSSWANRINREVSNSPELTSQTLNNFISQQNSIKGVLLANMEGNHQWIGLHSSMSNQFDIITDLQKSWSKITGKLNRIQRYHEAGFRKLEPVDSIIRHNHIIPVFFALEDSTKQFSLGIMIIDLPEFIRSTLGPRMQLISQEKFVISAFHEESDSLVYSTESIWPDRLQVDSKIVKQGGKTEFWLLPGYYVGIILKGATVDDLVRDRTESSLHILSFVLILLLSGIIFVYRNVKREIALAEAKSQFVSNVSHEIRTPLSLISMYAETLEMNRVPENRKPEYYSILVKETMRLSKLVNRILNFSQVEANKKKYSFQKIDLNTVVDEVLRSYQFQLDEQGFKYEFKPGIVAAVINADRESVTEAIFNLIDNAMKYSRENKCIYMSTGEDEQYFFFEIRDKGIGIPKTHSKAIFEHFFRVPTGDVHNIKGSGLGLSLVKKTMDAHGGKIKVESEVGRGSVFRLYFLHNSEN